MGLKAAGKLRRGEKATLKANVNDRRLLFGKHLLGVFHAQRGQILLKGNAGAIVKQMREIGFRNSEFFGKGIQGDRRSGIGEHIQNALPHDGMNLLGNGSYNFAL